MSPINCCTDLVVRASPIGWPEPDSNDTPGGARSSFSQIVKYLAFGVIIQTNLGVVNGLSGV